ncbi:TPA_exp: putative C6 finger domain protein [Trichophyton benhamiae CBS 112371]|nr:TPA_exp: putative C6 finger domain protein [Trichophyton benhamiae CBS 112371]
MQPEAQKRRSRSGCTECRQRHRKCDEKKPACTGCERAGKQCTYTMRLSWGGRPFSKSRFGECMKSDPSLVQLPVVSSSVDINDGRDSSLATPPPSSASDDPIEFESRLIRYTPPTPEVQASPFELSWLPKQQQKLLDHFISCTTLSMSCHSPIQDMFCRVLIPMATQTPHLMNALLSLAATHRLTLGMDQSMSELNHLKASSLRQLQDALAKPGASLDESVVATTLTLCHSDFVSDGRSPGSWRSHLQGTTTIISSYLEKSKASPDSLTNTMSLLWRWYLSIETVALLTGNLVMPNDSRALLQMRKLISDDKIDDLAGFSSSLGPIFKQINRLAIEADLALKQDEGGHLPADSDPKNRIPLSVLDESYQLINEIHSKMGPQERRFRPTVDASVHKNDFATVDEAFHHVALVQIYRRILNLTSTDPLVQSSVKHIISRICKVRFLGEPCPGIAVLQPLFTAGCEASAGPDRDSINTLLLNFEHRYGMGNARNCRTFLQDLWAMRDKSDDVEGKTRWDKVMVDKGLDILPY